MNKAPIPYGRQDVNQSDIEAVVEVLKSDFLTQGEKVSQFEKTVSSYCGARYAVATNSATSALHIACLSLGLGYGDWLWTTPITFVASANCGLYCGAHVDFVDIDPLTYNLSVDALKEKLLKASLENRLPKILVAVHLCGQPCNMAGIYSLSKEFGFKIIEDASHAIGGRYKGEPIGSGHYSDITVFSFHPVKIVTTGEGGMALTNDKDLAREMELLRSHGVTRDPELMTDIPDGPWYYQQIALGFNYRITDIQAALGISQMQRLDQFVAQRHYLSGRYDQLLADLPITTPFKHEDSYSGLHLYVIRIQLKSIKSSHKEVFEGLRYAGIGVNLHYIPVYLQPYYQSMGFIKSSFPEAESYYAEAISLPIYPTMTEQQQDYIVKKLRELLV